jgi:hypothetical protein
MSKLLGKKRQTKDTEDDDEFSKLKEHRNDDHESKSESEKEEKPKKTVFGDIPASKPGLFGNLEGEKNNKNKLFQDKGTSNPFSSSSIFTNTGSSLFNFGTNTSGSSLFTGQKLFDFSSIKKDEGSFFSKQETQKSDDEDKEEEGDDVLQGSESPNAYNPTEKKDEKNDFVKKFVRQIDNILVYNKEDNKFVSKGSGYISIEYTEVNKKAAFVVFR